jgi:hypothetical protein
MPASVKGAVALRKALREFSPDLAKETQKEIAAALKPITKAAKGYLPDNGSVLSNWRPRENSEARFPTYTAQIARAGVGYKTTPSKPNSRGFRSLARISNKSAAGAIYETMGRNTPSSQFVVNQNNKYSASVKGNGKNQGRVIFRAYEENNGKARDAVLKAIQVASQKLNAKAKV